MACSGRRKASVEESDGLSRWSRLTDKHRACLDLVVERKSSKEIARVLQISKPTVDQRITAARKILDAADRDQAAVIYARLKSVYDRVTYDPVQLPPLPVLVPSDFSDGDPSSVLLLSDSIAPSIRSGDIGKDFLAPFQEGWRHDYGIPARIMIMVAMLTALVIVVFLGLGIAETLTRLVSN
ncbi:helix-turn-helix transcriptional regulator [Sphingobium sp. AS12]|nr:helix-turn-helix transcriptional regulator [Sphingobium sp. AS12]QWT15995.1 helix-turn-helix transcriptional regulator [Sphingobium xenophagum]